MNLFNTGQQKNNFSIFDLKTEIFEKNSVFSDVVLTKEFKRLNNISFMGAIDYTVNTYGISHNSRTRAEHSIDVSVIAYHVASKRNYDEDLKNHLSMAGLLHDIGHLPLSHSLEHYFKERFKYGHHEIGEAIIRGEIGTKQSLSKLLKDNFDVNFILSLLNKEISSTYGGDLFSNSINIDTIDGIFKSSRYLSRIYRFDRLSLAENAFIEYDSFRELDKFWSLKNTVYNDLINTKYGVISDKLGEINFGEYLDRNLDEIDFFKSEKSWHQVHRILFNSFKTLKEKKFCDFNQELTYIDRKYFVDETSFSIKSRYKLDKHKAKYNISDDIYTIKPKENLQLEFKYE